MRAWSIILLLVSSVSVSAERVRVVVAVGLPELQTQSVAAQRGALRAEVITTLTDARDVELWGDSGAFSADVAVEEIERLRRDPRVRAVTIDDGGEGALLESLPLVGIDLVRAQGLDGSGVTVAVLDTGIDTDHPDFAGRVVAQQCFCDNLDGTGCCPGGEKVSSGPGAAEDDHGHGTHVTGIIASAGTIAPRGIAPNAKIVSVKVMDAKNSFRSFTQIHRALEWIADHQPDVSVINMSLGSFSLFSPDECGDMAIAYGMEPVVTRLRDRGVLITASSGNQASLAGTTLPSCMAPVIGVGATYDAPQNYASNTCSATAAKLDDVACFTNSTSAIDIVAPGAMIVSAMRRGGFANWAGTSMAAPHVAGAIALMQQKSHRKIDADHIESILKTTGKPVVDARNSLIFPRLDIAAALAATPKVDDRRRRSVRSGN